MVKRVRQFYDALTTDFDFSDVIYVRSILDEQEALLFFQMGRIEQKHAVNVAKTAEQLILKAKRPIDKTLLTKAALLHDIGKANGSMLLWHKVACVLLDKFDPQKAKSMASFEQPKGSLAYALYVYYNHPRIGARKIENIYGDYRLAMLVRAHHDDKRPKEIAGELYFLQKADEMN